MSVTEINKINNYVFGRQTESEILLRKRTEMFKKLAKENPKLSNYSICLKMDLMYDMKKCAIVRYFNKKKIILDDLR